MNMYHCRWGKASAPSLHQAGDSGFAILQPSRNAGGLNPHLTAICIPQKASCSTCTYPDPDRRAPQGQQMPAPASRAVWAPKQNRQALRMPLRQHVDAQSHFSLKDLSRTKPGGCQGVTLHALCLEQIFGRGWQLQPQQLLGVCFLGIAPCHTLDKGHHIRVEGVAGSQLHRHLHAQPAWSASQRLTCCASWLHARESTCMLDCTNCHHLVRHQNSGQALHCPDVTCCTC